MKVDLNYPLDIREFIPLVRRIAAEMVRRLPPNVMLDDLIQDGSIGLMAAFREHDPASGVPFNYFAADKIRWAIQDGLRAGDWATRSVRTQANKVTKATEQLQSSLGRKATEGEVAKVLGIRIENVSTIRNDAFGLEFIRQDHEDALGLQDIPDYSNEPSAIVDDRMTYIRAISCLKDLSANERRAFTLRIICDMNLREVAGEMNLTEGRISQLVKSASANLFELVEPAQQALLN